MYKLGINVRLPAGDDGDIRATLRESDCDSTTDAAATVIKGGLIVAAPMGDPNASIPTPQPVHYRPMFAAFGRAPAATAVAFVSAAALEEGVGERLGLDRRCVAVAGTRAVTKADLVLNDHRPHMEVDPQTYEVRADGELLTCEPAKVLPMAQRYFLF